MKLYKDSGTKGIGDIPQSWSCKQLGVFFSENRKVNSFLESITALQFKYGEIIQKPNNGYDISDKDRELLSRYTVIEPGDVVVNGLNLNFDLKSLRIAIAREKGIITSAYIVLRPRNKVNSEYYNYVLKALDYQKILHGMGVGIRLTLSYEELKKFPVPSPDASIQSAIVSYLDSKCAEIELLIRLQEQMIEKLKAYRQSVISEAVTKGLDPNAKLVPSGIDWIGDIPKGWKVAKIGRLFSFQGGYAFNSGDYVEHSNNQVIRIGNVKNDILLLDSSPVYINNSLAERAKNFRLKDGCILFTMTGTKGKKDYFYTLVLQNKHLTKKLYLNQRVGCFIPRENVCSMYYNYLLKENKILDTIFLYETGTANQGNLGIDTISRTLVQVPPQKEQHEISSFLCNKCAEVDKLISLKQRKILKLNEYKQSLIYEVVTGKKDIGIA